MTAIFPSAWLCAACGVAIATSLTAAPGDVVVLRPAPLLRAFAGRLLRDARCQAESATRRVPARHDLHIRHVDAILLTHPHGEQEGT